MHFKVVVGKSRGEVLKVVLPGGVANDLPERRICLKAIRGRRRL